MNEAPGSLSIKLLFLSKILKKIGRRVNVIIKDINSPNVIIHPKSIIGFIPLKIKDRKAQMVVNTV